MSELSIIRASAGSGKTFSLTESFLKIVMNEQSVDYFKRVLAVTFTNKATAEMKSRILKELHILSSGKKSNHLEELMKTSGKSEAGIRDKAKVILSFILHGYSWFRVETIDTFFQGIIRSFVRELNIPGNYNIEIDQTRILDEAIDRLLDKLGDDNNMLCWLMEYIDIKISEGKSWVVTGELQKLGMSLFKENLIDKMPGLQYLLQNSEFLKGYRDKLLAITSDYEKKITGLAYHPLSKMADNGFSDQDFYCGTTGTISYFRKLLRKEFILPGSRINAVMNNPEKWPALKCDRKPEAQKMGEEIFNPALEKIVIIIEKEGAKYNSAAAILKNLHILGLLTGLAQEISELRHNKGIFLISDAAPFIKRIINNNDTPFIYEKAGNHFHHLLIDEFQDTSAMQWHNFRPLISNSLSNNYNSLLIGDVKQSIYRWRNSNWEILETHAKNDFQSANVQEYHLETNWRSKELVIRFNNEFFAKASECVQQLVTDTENEFVPVTTIYSDVAQASPKHKQTDQGYVNIKVFDKSLKKEDEEYFGNELIARINEMLANNYKPGDIALLVRKKVEGALLANFLVNVNTEGKFISNVGVISNESLFLNGSPVVQLLISAMQFVYNGNDKLIAAKLLANYLHVTSADVNKVVDFPSGEFEIEELNNSIKTDFIEQCSSLRLETLYTLTEKLSNLLQLYNYNSEVVYLHSFLDVVFDYASSELSDLGSFLEYWEEEGAKKTISAAETSGSVKIITIHKSKGLQFPVVITPFCNWSISPKSGEQLWLEPKESPFNDIPYLPINYSKLLSESIFEHDFRRENYLTFVDNLNLLYVAFTRAENALIAFVQSENNSINSINDIIIKTLDTLRNNTEPNLKITYNKEESNYIIGQVEPSVQKTETKQAKLLTANKPANNLPKVRTNSQAIQFMNTTGSKMDIAIYGRILHSVMENILHKNDVEKAVQDKVESGILSQREGNETKSFLKKAINLEKAKTWFNSDYTILTESEIIGTTGQIRRPDRVMIKDDKAIIIDYKFGGEDKKSKHLKQVSDYMSLVQGMGYTIVLGYIWYVVKNDIVEVVS